MARAVYRLCHVWDMSAAPKANLVPEDADAACEAASDRALGDHSALIPAEVGNRRLLDYVRVGPDLDLERGVVEVIGRTALEAGAYGFEDEAVQPNEVSARAQR
jgi:hypothetical protein